MLSECEAIIVAALFELAKSEQKAKLFNEKTAAIFKLMATCRAYLKEGFLPQLVTAISQKKSDFLLEAKKISDIKEILGPPSVRYNGSEVVSNGRFSVPEEELIIWSLTSLRAPLISAGQKRYEKLFMEVLPDAAVSILGNRKGE